jgi:hypothetical protein
METRHRILDLARFLTELSVIDYFFVVYRPSVVALAALLNSVEAVHGDSKSATTAFEAELNRIPGFNSCRQEVLECSDRLQILYEQGGCSHPEIPQEYESRDVISPVCVTRWVTQETNAGMPEKGVKDESYGITIR